MKQTAVEWLIDQMLKQGYFEKDKPLTFTNLGHLQHQAEEMEKQQMEISDEEIEIEADKRFNNTHLSKQMSKFISFCDGAKWYRQQLKSKQ